MEHILRNVLMALLEQPAATMHDILRIFSDKDFRSRIARSERSSVSRKRIREVLAELPSGCDSSYPKQNRRLSRRPDARSDAHCAKAGASYSVNNG